MSEIEIGWYKHFKGGFYYVLGTGIHTETREWFVIYHPKIGATLQVRPYEMFVEEVQPGVKRFEKI